MWEAVEVNGRTSRAIDPETGARMKLNGTPEIDRIDVAVSFPDGEEVIFNFRFEPKVAKKDRDGRAPNILLSVAFFQNVVRKRSRGFSENTRLVRYLIEGLATINRKWPLCKDPYFYSDLNGLVFKGTLAAEFEFPSDEDLALLSRGRGAQ